MSFTSTVKSTIKRYPVLKAPARAMVRAFRAPTMATIDRLAEAAAEDFVLHVPEFEGAFALSPRSDLFKRIVLNGYYEPEFVAIFRRWVNPEMDILDIGANIGFFSVLGAKLLNDGRRVLAAEPTAAASARLRANLARNDVTDRVIVYKGLVSDTPGEHQLNVVPGKEEYSSMADLSHPSIVGQASTSEVVPAQTLDSLVTQHNLRPGLLKIDVEGAEKMVLSGAGQTIQTFRPVVMTELSGPLLRKAGTSAAEIVGMMQKLDYVVTDPWTGGPVGADDNTDMLAVPQERAKAAP